MEEIFRVAAKNLSQQKLRTALTLLGVIVGIATIVALMSLGDSMKGAVNDQLSQLGPNRVMVTPKSFGGGFGPPSGGGIALTDKDLRRIENIGGVDIAIPIIFKTLPVTYKDETAFLTVTAFPAEETETFFKDVQSFEIDEGRFLKDGEKNSLVVGSLVLTDVFSKNPRLKSKLTVKGEGMRIVGAIKPVGNSRDDAGIMTTIETMKDIVDTNEYTLIMVKVKKNPDEVAEEIEKELKKLHNEDLFTAFTTEQLIEQINSVLSIITVVLGGIAAISLLVAAFGIMNTMLMSVLERTREIGIMKAIGATNKRILSIFLAESMIVGLIGGILGVAIGAGFSKIIASFASNFIGVSLQCVITPQLAGFSIGFAVVVGVISGVYPARRAAKLDPVEALRYE